MVLQNLDYLIKLLEWHRLSFLFLSVPLRGLFNVIDIQVAVLGYADDFVVFDESYFHV